MADLNDFFAKKDRKKSKGIKFTTANEIDKKIREIDRKREQLQNRLKDSEWKEFEEKKKDYTGLKIQNTMLEEEDVAETEISGDENSPGPWKANVPVTADHPTNKTAWKRVVKEQPPDNVISSNVDTYIPPHLRNKPALMNTSTKQPRQGLHDSKVTFPELAAALTDGTKSSWSQKKSVEAPSKSDNS